MSNHVPASKRANRLKPGPAAQTKWGDPGNKNKSPKRYGKVAEAYHRMMGTSVFAL